MYETTVEQSDCSIGLLLQRGNSEHWGGAGYVALIHIPTNEELKWTNSINQLEMSLSMHTRNEHALGMRIVVNISYY